MRKLVVLLLGVIILGSILASAQPSWIKEGEYLEYEITAKIKMSPPSENFPEEYFVVGKAIVVITGFDEERFYAYYMVEQLNDTKSLTYLLVGQPGTKYEGNVSWTQNFTLERFPIYVNPALLPENGVKELSSINSNKNITALIKVTARFDTETGLLIEYSSMQDFNDTVNNRRVTLWTTYKLINTNIEQLKKYLPKQLDTTTTTETQSTSTTTTIKTATQPPAPMNTRYPIEIALVVIVAITVGLILLALKQRR